MRKYYYTVSDLSEDTVTQYNVEASNKEEADRKFVNYAFPIGGERFGFCDLIEMAEPMNIDILAVGDEYISIDIK